MADFKTMQSVVAIHCLIRRLSSLFWSIDHDKSHMICPNRLIDTAPVHAVSRSRGFHDDVGFKGLRTSSDMPPAVDWHG